MTTNPFEVLDSRLVEIESLLLDIKLKVLKDEDKDPFEDLPEYLTRVETAKILNISLSKLDQLSNEGRLIKHRNGTLVRFKKSEVKAFYQSFRKYQRL